jgi:dTMP kinase
MKKGLFIAFEGIDGCGKSTQVRRLAQHILELSKYNHVLITREPFEDTKIRDILKQDEDPYSQARKLAQMFVNDRKLHVKTIIAENVRKGLFVISDRYSFSTLAYQQAQGIPLQELLELHRGLPIPDIIFVVDVPVEVAMKRMKKDAVRKAEHKFEKNTEFIGKLRMNYFNLARLPKHKVVMIDGRKSAEEIFEKQIKPAFDKFLMEKGEK